MLLITLPINCSKWQPNEQFVSGSEWKPAKNSYVISYQERMLNRVVLLQFTSLQQDALSSFHDHRTSAKLYRIMTYIAETIHVWIFLSDKNAGIHTSPGKIQASEENTQFVWFFFVASVIITTRLPFSRTHSRKSAQTYNAFKSLMSITIWFAVTNVELVMHNLLFTVCIIRVNNNLLL